MIQIDMKNKAVLITGGTKGIGLATALQFAMAGARTYLTYKWGSADLDKLGKEFEKKKAEKPVLLEADVSVDEDTDKLLAQIAKTEKKIDIFISNVGFAQRTMSIDEYKKRSLFKTLEYSTWPMIEYSRKINKLFKKYPSYIVGISSDGPDHFYQGYDFVAASKALLEFFAKYLSIHLFEEGSRVNVIRFGTVKTESFSQIFGEEFFDFLKENDIPEKMILTPEDCGRSVFALCSGYLDAMNGQIISVDHGMPFRDNLMMRYLSIKNKKK
ncbi:MAG: SDR family oxidoreductase [Spirochaetes bacterium]|nr:SDR family oxidoreductase [Spirochaetota bacterium]